MASDPMAPLGKLLIVAGGLLLVVGLALVLGPRLPYLGRLPGDIVWTRGNFRIYLPITTSVLLSLGLTILLALVNLLRR